MPAAVRVVDLVYRYGRAVAVDGVCFDVGAGEVFGLLGPNGAGKSTTLECVLGLRRPAGGTVAVGGFDVAKNPAAARAILGAQLQSTQLQDKLTPRQAVRFFRSFYRHGADVDELIGRFGLNGSADKPFDALSAGQRQRVGLALAFVNDPAVVVLDEPTAGLDPSARRELHGLIRSLKADGRTVLLSTHYVDEAAALCDRIGVIAGGKLVRVGTPGELVRTVSAKPAVVVRTDPAAMSWGDLSATAVGDEWRFETDDVATTVAAVAAAARTAGGKLVDVRTVRPTLEQAVVDLSTGAA